MPRTVIHSVVLFDGQRVHPDATVIFDSKSGIIASVSHGSDVDKNTLKDDIVIDGTGHTLLPGLIDAHIHCYSIHFPPGTDTSFILGAPLKCGITTVCDMHSDVEAVNKLRKEATDELARARKHGGAITMSDLKSALYAATIDGGWPKPIVLGEEPTEEVSF